MIKTTFKRTVPILLLSVILLTNSCQKQQEILSSLDGTALQQLKDIYLSNNIPTHRLFSKMEPLWDRAYAMEQEKETVYELPLSNSERIFQGEYIEEKPEEAQRKNNIRLIMTRANADGAYRSFYMSIINDGEATDLTSLHYKNVNDFSGKILFYTLKGEFINGWHYSSGKISGSLSPSNKQAYEENRLMRLKAGNDHINSKSGKISSLWWPGDCEQQLIPTYGISCVTVVTSVNCQLYQNGSTYVTVCSGSDGGSNDDGGVGNPPGGSGTPQPTYDCAGVMNGSAVSTPCGCIGGTTGLVSCPLSEEVLKNEIENKPFALFPDVDCETLKKWLETAEFKPDQTIIDKLNGLTTSGFNDGKLGKRIASIQKIDDAYSSVVNMDYFPVKIEQLPIVNGQRLGPGQFLNYIRTHINDFTDNSKMFNPYNNYGIDDRAKWNSNDPIGAIVAIDMPGPDNGSVITTYSSTDRWTFTTIKEPMYGEHPVSGNRNFGYKANTDGSYTFYTQGVDRLTSWDVNSAQVIPEFFKSGAGVPFAKADELWTSLQNGIKNFVTSHSGAAEVGNVQILRPNWDLVKEVMAGKKPLNTLSKDCPD